LCSSVLSVWKFVFPEEAQPKCQAGHPSPTDGPRVVAPLAGAKDRPTSVAGAAASLPSSLATPATGPSTTRPSLRLTWPSTKSALGPAVTWWPTRRSWRSTS
jgi:hypothetical protein